VQTSEHLEILELWRQGGQAIVAQRQTLQVLQQGDLGWDLVKVNSERVR